MKQRGVFEKVPGSGVWWILYYDQYGRRHREKVGAKKLAVSAYQKRKTEIRESRFFPEKLNKREVDFPEIAKDALEYAKEHKAADSYRADRWHMETILGWFRERAAADVTPQDIERRLVELGDQGRKPAPSTATVLSSASPIRWQTATARCPSIPPAWCACEKKTTPACAS